MVSESSFYAIEPSANVPRCITKDKLHEVDEGLYTVAARALHSASRKLKTQEKVSIAPNHFDHYLRRVKLAFSFAPLLIKFYFPSVPLFIFPFSYIRWVTRQHHSIPHLTASSLKSFKFKGNPSSFWF